MSSLSDIGNLMHLYLDDISPNEGTDAAEFLIKASAENLFFREFKTFFRGVSLECCEYCSYISEQENFQFQNEEGKIRY